MGNQISFLAFMLPLGNSLTPTLTSWTADFVEFAVRAVGVPVYREAADFILPTGRWSVIAACSGLRYLLSAIVLAALFAHLNFSRPLKAAVFFTIVVVAAVVMNWFRAAITVFLGHLTNMRFGPGDEHMWLGWILFGIVMYVICHFASQMADPDDLDYVSEQVLKPAQPEVAVSRKDQVFLGFIILICGSVFLLSLDKNLVNPKVDVGVKLAQQIGGDVVSKVAYEVPFNGYQE